MFNKSQLYALERYYNALNGYKWGYPADKESIPWNFSTSNPNPCTPIKWNGLSCDRNNDSIVNIEMRDFSGVSGQIPYDLFVNLTSIRIFSVSGDIIGSIPSSFDYIKNLEILDIEATGKLTGSIPPSLMSHTELKVLSISGGLEGSIPSSLVNMTKLETLSLSDCRLSGKIPSFLGSLTKLKILVLSTGLQGTIPDALMNLHQLELLVLSPNSLTGSIPSTIGLLTSLKAFSLWANFYLSGTIPPSICSLTNLNTLQLSVNPLIEGPIPADIGNLSKLEILRLHGMGLNGTLPESLCDLTNLKTLHLFDNKFTGHLLPCITNMVSLFDVEVYNNGFTGPIPDFDPLNVGAFIAYHNQLSGTIPASLLAMSTLQVVYLDGNLLTGTIPSTAKLINLRTFSVYDNQLYGDIVFENSPQLKYLVLENNSFSGSLQSIANCENLQHLLLQGNQFSGELPDFFWTYAQLSVLDITGNRFTGSLPTDLFGKLAAIQNFYIGSNLFTGPLPAINMSSTIKQVDFSDNYFEGTLTDENFIATNIDSVSYAVNCLDVKLPVDICDSPATTLILSGLHTISKLQ